MDDERIDAALDGLAQNRPRAPAKTIDDMANTVNAFEAEKQRRLGKNTVIKQKKELAPKQTQRTAEKKAKKDKGKTL
ncbi:MAG: hypothetical protein IKW87_10000 [Ruminococcus sp.]|jgi:hypothetical protein|nr:hypothetical protein [Ruminococcus sp.]